MSTVLHTHTGPAAGGVDSDGTGARPARKRRTVSEADLRGRWWRFALILAITAVVLIPILVVLVLAFSPSSTSSSTGITFENFTNVFEETLASTWLKNSLVVTLSTVLVSVAVAAPAGYVLSRGRSRAVAGYSLLLFVMQSLPIITSVVPLFILFATMGLVDNLLGLTIVYVASTMTVATWMMAAYFDSIPASLEEASWIDGCSVFGSFRKIVLRNSLPGVLSTAIFAFLLAWNDYLVAIVFLRSNEIFTLPMGVQSFFQQNQTDWGGVMALAVVMMLPPIIVFAALNKYFSVGGIGGSLAGR
ncbi:ABC transporter permease [Sinomonas atrocyanea]|uniref:ABC transporter permease n=1 Tax=Sinomonas atrocyanea TaxID=37927 RepID=A0A126ZVP8_9MICC|nr:carbohydrate ABC transporter permease [Sinomonas atrocyanea]AMM31230.1 ABC transporter permease [Sinomonas atrocyanea]GEB66093.1 ABC transporter permease [Sinomonas atrocyanea]GGG81710.1 ABC transporter permease [Sinomonas atrocyanea]